MTFKLVVVVLLILINGFFALSEMAVVVSRRAKLREMATHSRRARSALELSDQPERFLSTVQIGSTVVSLLTGLVGGALFGPPIGDFLAGFGLNPDLAYALGLVLSVTFLTYFTVVIGELLPKRAALLAPEKIASNIALPMRVIARITAPFVWLLSRSIHLLMRLLRLGDSPASTISEEEIRLLVAESHEQGLIDADERKMMNRVMRLGDRTAENLMTPRTRIAWLDLAATPEENFEVLRTTPYSIYPVYRGSDSEVVGILETKSLASLFAQGDSVENMFNVLSEPLFVSESTRAMTLLETFRDHNAHMALVVDEYGDLQGLVTRNDLFGAVLGRLPQDEGHAGQDRPVTRRDDGSYLVDGSLSSEDLRELLNLSQLPDEEEHDYNTAAGLIVAHFGRIPDVGEFFIHQGWRFEVVDLDGARVDKLLLQRIPQRPVE